MLLTYEYKGDIYKVFIHWTADTGCSAVFQEIAQRISDKHQLVPGEYWELAKQLDAATDKLYEQIYIFTNEHHGVPYNPRFRRLVLNALSEISDKSEGFITKDGSGHERLLSGLFNEIVDKLRETVDVYLAENTYQGRHRYQRTHFVQYSETTDENMMIYGFEDVLLQMTDLARVLDCLTEIQRRRLVKHIFLKYTLREIAERERVNTAVVYRSVAAALKKIKLNLTQ